MKLHIIGLPGSGKTTLAAHLGDRTGILPVELDLHSYWEGGVRSEQEIMPLLEEARTTGAWITEGAQCDPWLAPHLAEADVILWLDPPLRTCAWRSWHRELERRRDDRRWLGRWRQAVLYLARLRREEPVLREGTSALLAPFEARVRRCRSAFEIAAVRDELSHIAIDWAGPIGSQYGTG